MAVIMPAGGGKSPRYRLPAIVAGRLCAVDARRMRQIREYVGETPKFRDKCGDCDACAGLPDWLQKDTGK